MAKTTRRPCKRFEWSQQSVHIPALYYTDSFIRGVATPHPFSFSVEKSTIGVLHHSMESVKFASREQTHTWPQRGVVQSQPNVVMDRVTADDRQGSWTGQQRPWFLDLLHAKSLSGASCMPKHLACPYKLYYVLLLLACWLLFQIATNWIERGKLRSANLSRSKANMTWIVQVVWKDLNSINVWK